MSGLWIIEKRGVHGELMFDSPQPEEVFGRGAITGITDDVMAKVIYRLHPEAVLSGMNIPHWPRHVNANFVARRKTW